MARVPIRAELLGALALAVGNDSVWVTAGGDTHGSLLRIPFSSDQVSAMVPVGWAPAELAVAGGSAWVADTVGDGSRPQGDQNEVLRVDLSSGRVLARIRVLAPGAIVASTEAAWVAQSAAGSTSQVVRIDSASNRPTWSTPLPGLVSELTVADGSLWVSTDLASATGQLGTIARLDLTSGRTIGEISLPAPGRLLVAAGGLWVVLSSPDGGTPILQQIDPSSGQLAGPPLASPELDGIVAGSEAGLWVAHAGELSWLRLPDLARQRAPVALIEQPGESVVALVPTKTDVWVLTNVELIQLALEN